jgi:hypothetical protein
MMRRIWVLVLAVGAVAAFGAGPVAISAGAVRAAGPWGRAIEVPGLGALSNGKAAQVFALSCPSPGNCSAGGDYRSHGRRQGFVASEKNGRWGTAIEVPGLGALNKDGYAEVNDLSCASAGNCAAGGDYMAGGLEQAFVVDERDGRWDRAIEVSGFGRHGAEVLTVSCPSPGNCGAGGDYTTNSVGRQAFVVSERNGRWGQELEVPGLAALNKGAAAYVFSVSCVSAGNCTAGGTYSYNEDSGASLGFLVSEQNSRWGRANEVPGLKALNTGSAADIISVSCSSVGNCSGGGDYSAGDNGQGFVVSEKAGHWGRAIAVTGSKDLNKGGLAIVLGVSCGSAGNCAAGGWTSPTDFGGYEAFVVLETHGRWGKTILVPGLVALTKGGFDSQAFTVSCGSASSCAVGGDYASQRQGQEGFVAVERNGRWGTAAEVPGLATLNRGGQSAVNVVSCASAGSCVAGGTYSDPLGPNGFVSG